MQGQLEMAWVKTVYIWQARVFSVKHRYWSKANELLGRLLTLKVFSKEGFQTYLQVVDSFANLPKLNS